MKAHGLLDATPLDRTPTLTVLGQDRGLPTWVRDWCRAADRQIRVMATTDPLERIDLIAGLAGSSILLSSVDDHDVIGVRPVVAAVRALPDDERVLAEAASAARVLRSRLSLVHVVPVSFAERSVHMDDALTRGRRLLDRGVDQLAATAPDVTVEPSLLRQWPHELVGEELDAALLVLGGPRPGLPARVGLVTSSAVQHARCPVLLAPRPAWPPVDPAAPR